MVPPCTASGSTGGTLGSRSSCFCYLPLFHVTIIIRTLSLSPSHSYSSLSYSSLSRIPLFLCLILGIPGHESSQGESGGGRLLAYASQVHQGGSPVNHLRSRTRCEGCGIPCPLPLLPLCPRPVSSKSRDWTTATLVRWESRKQKSKPCQSKKVTRVKAVFWILLSRGSSCFQAVVPAKFAGFEVISGPSGGGGKNETANQSRIIVTPFSLSLALKIDLSSITINPLIDRPTSVKASGASGRLSSILSRGTPDPSLPLPPSPSPSPSSSPSSGRSGCRVAPTRSESTG